MNEQIKDMAKLMCEDCAASGEHCPAYLCNGVVQQAQVLYNAGYRKQSEGEWIARDCTSKSKRGRIINYATYKCSVCGTWNGRHKHKYCPKCGAHMKGGDS